MQKQTGAKTNDHSVGGVVHDLDMTFIVPVYSVAKAYTAAAAFLSLDPNDPVGKYVATLPDELACLRIQELLTHRSGLNDYYSWPDYRAAVSRRDDPWPVDSILRRAEVDTPGKFRYSNIGFSMVRMALERIHGKAFFDLLDDLIFAPLGIAAMPFATGNDWHACNHPKIDDRLRNYHPGWVYPGTFAADPQEAARGLALLMRGQLGPDVSTFMQRASPVEAPGHPMLPGGYGPGLMVRGTPGTEVGHGGQGPGFNLFVASTPDGSRWCGAVDAQEGEDTVLIQSCLDALRT